MATAYPSVAVSVNSDVRPVDGRYQNVASSGKFGAGSHVVTIPYLLTIRHDLISSADYATLESFYGSNRQTADVSIAYFDGETYEGVLLNFEGGMSIAGLFSVTVTMIGVQQ